MMKWKLQLMAGEVLWSFIVLHCFDYFIIDGLVFGRSKTEKKKCSKMITGMLFYFEPFPAFPVMICYLETVISTDQ